MNLDFLPSSSPEHPGLVIRDPYHFSDAVLIVPPLLVECLQNFNGARTDLDLRAMLVARTGQLDVGGLQQHLIDTLSKAGFLEDETYQRMEEQRRQEFRDLPVRTPAHAGGAYPDDADELKQTMATYLANGTPKPGGQDLIGIAAPHVSPEGGWKSYQAAYGALGPEYRDRTFVILGTSHYGTPEKFGLTRKRFATPFGEAECDTRLVNWLAGRAPASIEMEDYCHSFEHTIEFQVVFLQSIYGPNVKILPVLCGSFAQSIYDGGKPEKDDAVKAFFNSLGELNDREGKGLFWVLGVDMAHMGVRYGDGFQAFADAGEMSAVAARDQARIDRINAADADGFWDLVQENRDDLKWCGSAPFYTFLKSVPGARGTLGRYEQWNIDEQSVVSFAGMSFRASQ